MISEYEIEPVRGLPALLPEGEHILWQGSPEWRALARTAFHTRLIAGYFAVLVTIAAITAVVRGGGLIGVGLTAGLGIAGVALLHVLAWASARAAIYTLTNKRLVLRIGVALPKCINLPLALIGAVDMTVQADGTGDLPLAVTGAQRLGYAQLWPHARPWRVAVPQPMLRSIRDAEQVGKLIARTCLAAQHDGKVVPIESARDIGAAIGTAVAA